MTAYSIYARRKSNKIPAFMRLHSFASEEWLRLLQLLYQPTLFSPVNQTLPHRKSPFCVSLLRCSLHASLTHVHNNAQSCMWHNVKPQKYSCIYIFSGDAAIFDIILNSSIRPPWFNKNIDIFQICIKI